MPSAQNLALVFVFLLGALLIGWYLVGNEVMRRRRRRAQIFHRGGMDRDGPRRFSACVRGRPRHGKDRPTTGGRAGRRSAKPGSPGDPPPRSPSDPGDERPGRLPDNSRSLFPDGRSIGAGPVTVRDPGALTPIIKKKEG